MTFHYWHPSVTPRSKLNPELLAYLVRNKADEMMPGPSDRVVTHYDTMRAEWPGGTDGLNNNYYGTLFEQSIYDALLHYGVPGATVVVGKDFSKGKNADIDFLVTPADGPVVAILAKTSMKERWKQFDRDALVIEAVQGLLPRRGRDRGLIITGLFLREKPGDGAAKMIDLAEQKEGLLHSQQLSIITALDEKRMESLFKACGATKL